MRLDEIHAEWAADAAVDKTELDRVAREIPLLHAKYLRYMSEERMILKKLGYEMEQLKNAKIDRLSGKMSKEDLEARGWTPEPKRYIRSDYESVLSADKDIIELKLRIALQQEKVDVLESIVKMVMNRNFVIKSAIDWVKFQSGAG